MQYTYEQECIPVGCVSPTEVAITGGSPHTPGADPPMKQIPLEQAPPGAGTPWSSTPWVWAWGDPAEQATDLGVGLETPQVWAWRPPWPDPSTSPLGVGLETCEACWDTP